MYKIIPGLSDGTLLVVDEAVPHIVIARSAELAAPQLLAMVRAANADYCPDCGGMVAGQNGIPTDFLCCWCNGTGKKIVTARPPCPQCGWYERVDATIDAVIGRMPATIPGISAKDVLAAKLEEVINIIGNLPSGYAEDAELDADIENCSPEDAARFQAGLAVRALRQIIQEVTQ